MSFQQASEVTGGPGAWTAVIQPGWDLFGITNGGYVMAVATRAIQAESGDRQLISCTGHYLNTVSAGPLSIEVATLKEGRRMSTLRARLSRGDKQLVTVTAVLAEADRQAFEGDLVDAEPPNLPPPDACPRAEPSEGAPFPPPFTGRVDVRVHPEDAAALLGEKTGKPLMRGWFRLRDGQPLDSHAVVMATDAFPPAIYNSNLPMGWSPTIELSVQVRNPAPTGWLACRFSTRFVTSGIMEEDGELWDEDGGLVAISRQLALVPR